MRKAKKNLWRGFTTVTASLLIVTVGASAIADNRASFLNSRLGTSNYKMVQNESDTDGIYFDSDYDSLEELVQAKVELSSQIASEGAVLLKNNGALPLDKDSEKVTLWGLNSAEPILGGLIGSSVVVSSSGEQTAYGI